MEQVDKEVQAENQERSNSSSFEDLSNEGKEIRSDTVKDEQDQPLDILGNGQLLKKVQRLINLENDSTNNKQSI